MGPWQEERLAKTQRKTQEWLKEASFSSLPETSICGHATLPSTPALAVHSPLERMASPGSFFKSSLHCIGLYLDIIGCYLLFPLSIHFLGNRCIFIFHLAQGSWSQCHWLCCCYLVTKTHLTLCDPMDCNLPGSCVHGISQAKILEWVAISSSRGSFQLRHQTHTSCLSGGFWTMSHLGSQYYWHSIQFSQFSRSVVSDSLRPHESQHARPPCPSPTPRVHSNSRPSSGWRHPAISSSVVPFSSCPQPLPASESFSMSQLFAWGGQSTRVSALALFLPKKSHGWSPSEWTGWISLQSKGLSKVFSNTTVQKHQFFGTQLSSQSNSHIYTWPLEKP